MVKWCFIFAKAQKKQLRNSQIKIYLRIRSSWANQGLNLGPPDYESVALTN